MSRTENGASTGQGGPPVRWVAVAVPFADPVFAAEMCHCCGMQPIGDRDGVRCGRCAGPEHEFRGWGCGDVR